MNRPILDHPVERLDREELRRLQLERLTALLSRIAEKNDFYRAIYRKAGIDVTGVDTLEDFYERLPFLDKKILLQDQVESPPYGRRLEVPRDQIAYSCFTSGSSGLGQEVHPFTIGDIEALSESWSFMFRWAGIARGDRAYSSLPLGIQIGGISLVQALERFGCELFPFSALSSEMKLELMERFPPHYLIVVPAYLIRLSVLCEERGLDPRHVFPSLKVITVATQGYSVEWAREMEEFWGARLCEPYASTQASPGVMSTCEFGVYREDGTRGMMHALEDRLLFEVIDPDTRRHVDAGEEGELVVTTLTREATPLIRFRMDDKVVYLPNTYCGCGRPFAGIQAGTIARYDDMIKIKGQNIWPDAVDSVVFSSGLFEEYAGRVFIDHEGREQVSLSVELKQHLEEGLRGPERDRAAQELAHELRDRLGVRMDVQLVQHGTLERFIFKARRWVDERKEGRQVLKHVVPEHGRSD